MSSHSAANLQQRQSQQSLNSHFDPETPRPAYLTAFGDDLRSTRSSVVSLQELEHGWGSNVAALNSANKGGIPETHSNRPPANGTRKLAFAQTLNHGY